MPERQPPPHHADVEAGLCSGVLGGEINPLDLAPLLPEHCFLKAHERVLTVAIEMAGEGLEINIVTVGGRLQERGWFDDVGHAAGLGALLNECVTPASLDEAKRLVIHAWARRQALAVMHKHAVTARHHGGDTPSLLASVCAELEKLQEACGVADAPTDLLTGYKADFAHREQTAEAAQSLLAMPWGQVNEAMDGGLWPKTLFILGARPGCGKTAFAIEAARQCAATPPEHGGGGALIVSVELPADQIRQRLVCAASGLTRAQYRHGGEYATARLTAVIPGLCAMPLWIDEASKTVNTIRATVRRHKRMAEAAGVPLRLVAIDYIQIVKADGLKFSSREQEIAHVSKALMGLRAEFPETTFLVLAQLNRESADGRKPRDSDLRECGQLEQDADTIALLWRSDKNDAERVSMTFAKNRGLRLDIEPTFRVVQNIGTIEEVTP